ncbi:MAG: lincosamide and streptogramin A transport system ATP-binding/permease protein [Myxococcota bacterium]|jgi:lincosamide and streptogramin A transport system ATP-binding/permease protein
MSSIRAKNLSFHYDNPYVPVFNQLDLTLDTRWRIGLLGRNGRGKTTLLKLLSGALSPVAGQLSVPIPIVSFPAEPDNPHRPTRQIISDAVAPFAAWQAQLDTLLSDPAPDAIDRYGELLYTYEAHGGYDFDARLSKECALIGLSASVLDRDFATLSGGEQTRALIIALFLKPDAFPLIDEPTNHLDLAGRERLAQYLTQKSGFLLVSHDRSFLTGCVDHIVSINRSDVRVHRCGLIDWQRQMQQEEEHERRRSTNLKLQVRAMERAAKKRRSWSDSREGQKHEKNPKKRERISNDTGYIGRRAALQMKRALNIERRMTAALAEKTSLLRNVEKTRKLQLVTRDDAPDQVVMLEDVTVQPGEATLFAPLTLTVRRGERIAIVGENGCGKTSLLRLILGELPPATGVIYQPGHVSTSVSRQIPRWRTGLLRGHLQRHGIDETRFRTLMGSFGVRGELFERPLETFSMGQRKKVDLCRSFLDPAHMLLWDEPLNYVDMFSREQIESVIMQNHPTMVFIEHDRAFIERVATRVVHLQRSDQGAGTLPVMVPMTGGA